MTGNDKVLFLFGNGLSVALSSEFSLQIITEKFINSLDGDEKKFFEALCTTEKGLNFDDFEVNFSQLESSYLNLKKYRLFMDSRAGKTFLEKFNLDNPNLIKHENIIKSIYQKYILMILDIIHGKVKLKEIEGKLARFSDFFVKTLTHSVKGYVFTLNYDLLVETILLEKFSNNSFTDFCLPSGNYKKLEIIKYDFDPAISKEYFEYTNSQKVELHHLHGSLSFFYDLERNKAIKFKSEDIKIEDVYRRLINEEADKLIPAIITGGGKSEKIMEYPFEYYFRELKRVCDTGEANKLFIVGYSFRDEHINDLINRWRKNVDNYEDGLLIVDYKNTDEEKNDFKKFVKKQLRIRKDIPDQCFVFEGANEIRDVTGTTRNTEKVRRCKKNG